MINEIKKIMQGMLKNIMYKWETIKRWEFYIYYWWDWYLSIIREHWFKRIYEIKIYNWEELQLSFSEEVLMGILTQEEVRKTIIEDLKDLKDEVLEVSKETRKARIKKIQEEKENLDKILKELKNNL